MVVFGYQQPLDADASNDWRWLQHGSSSLEANYIRTRRTASNDSVVEVLTVGHFDGKRTTPFLITADDLVDEIGNVAAN